MSSNELIERIAYLISIFCGSIFVIKERCCRQDQEIQSRCKIPFSLVICTYTVRRQNCKVYLVHSVQYQVFLISIFFAIVTVNKTILKAVKIMRSQETGRNLSYGFVYYLHRDAAVAAINNLDGYLLRGRSLRY